MDFPQPARPARYPSNTASFVAMLLLGLALSAPAFAQQAGTPPRGNGLALGAVLDLALQENPEILAALARVDAAAERPGQSHSLPDPILSGVFRNVGFSDITIGEEMMSQAGIRFTQALPYKGKRDLRGCRRRGPASSVAERRSSNLDLPPRSSVTSAETASSSSVTCIVQAIRVVEDTRGYLVNLEQTAQARYAVGEGIQQDVLKAQVEISVLAQPDDRLGTADATASRRSLNRLLARART